MVGQGRGAEFMRIGWMLGPNAAHGTGIYAMGEHAHFSRMLPEAFATALLNYSPYLPFYSLASLLSMDIGDRTRSGREWRLCATCRV
jgi:hypothetical protein